MKIDCSKGLAFRDRRLRSIAGWLLVALGCLLLVALVRGPRGSEAGSISVTYNGLTTNASGSVSGKFMLSNGYAYPVFCAAGVAQVRKPGGWQMGGLYGHPGCVFTAAPESVHVFEVVAPTQENVVWRAPVLFQKVETRLDRWNQEFRRRLGFGSQQPWSVTNSAEVVGTPRPGEKP